MPEITAITPTGDRPEALYLCQLWMRRQTIRDQVTWIVVDDGRTPARSILDEVDIYLRLPPIDGVSLGRNLLAGLRLASTLKFAIIEDDDWYAPDYLAWLATQLDNFPIVGETSALYYNVAGRAWMECGNRKHASLSSTGFRADTLVDVIDAIKKHHPWIDEPLWRRLQDLGHLHLPDPDSRRVIGVKGMPGRTGIGQDGHRVHAGYSPDPSLTILRDLIGNDADRYARFFKEHRGLVQAH